MASVENTSRATAAILLASAVLIASCAGRPNVELASAVTTVPDALAETIEALAAPTTTSMPILNADTSTPQTTMTDGLLAGGVDPATLVTTPDGEVLVQPTPAALQNRQLQTVSLLTPPVSDEYESTVQPFEGDPLRRSTWNELCPVPTDELRYVTVSFWGFDGNHHTGELIVAAGEADNVVDVFGQLHAVRFPIEGMRIVTPLDVVARRTGDGNNTASYVCRQVTGGTRFSEHALGLAIDINPFQNPYQRGDEVIPALASSYLDRSNVRPGMIVAGEPLGDAVIAAFAEAGWAWGGDWNSLKDYQHFALHNR